MCCEAHSCAGRALPWQNSNYGEKLPGSPAPVVGTSPGPSPSSAGAEHPFRRHQGAAGPPAWGRIWGQQHQGDTSHSCPLGTTVPKVCHRAELLSAPVSYLFNLVLEAGVFPLQPCGALLPPSHKSGSFSPPGCRRAAISGLTPCTGCSVP